jgi:hypothetical protein
MLDFLILILIVGGLLLFAWGICEALGRVAAHARGNPDAAKAIVEHVFMPLFGTKKEPERKHPPGTAMMTCHSPEEPTSSN